MMFFFFPHKIMKFQEDIQAKPLLSAYYFLLHGIFDLYIHYVAPVIDKKPPLQIP
jgi:hypothetical protein